MKIFVRPNGDAQCLYSDQIPLGSLGKLDIKRASHVEPDPEVPGKWYVDLGPVGGPRISGYATRAEALAFEEDWLNTRMVTTHLEAT